MLILSLAEGNVTEELTEDINRLLLQLTDNAKRFEMTELRNLIAQDNLFVYAVFDRVGKLVGMASIKFDRTRMFTQNYFKAYIGDLVVDDGARGQGVGVQLTTVLIVKARSCGAKHINLTSNPNNPNRAAAIRMYEKLGFREIGQIGPSNYYRLEL